MGQTDTSIAIVDYGLGNLYSVKNVCEHVGLQAFITSSRDELFSADAVVLPGVGAFGDAMENLRRLDLVGPLQEIASSVTPLIGICLGMQLLMSESYEFGKHRGLGIFEGPVVRFEHSIGTYGPPQDRATRPLKVPQIGWNRISRKEVSWEGSLLSGLPDGVFMYYVHSFYVLPQNAEAIRAVSRYGDIEFCSSLTHRNVHAFQFHPERSGPNGLHIYRNLAALLRERVTMPEK